MASHQLAIAKASFSAGLLRPDPASVSRDNIEHFHTLLNATITQCSPTNVQNCKRWILQHIAQSTARYTSLGKYLTALATSFTTSSDGKGKREPSTKRKRLHLLYLINDILNHAKSYNDVSIYGKIQPVLVGLVGSATSFKGCPKHQKKIRDLLDIWEEKGYYAGSYIKKLREAANNAAEGGELTGEVASEGKDVNTKAIKSAPFVMPATHGDSSTPWFDLPAANLMPLIVPNSTRPINPDQIKPLQFVAGPADESLVAAVKALLEDVEAIFGETDQHEKASWDIDELGQPIMLDEITGDVIDGEGYYGWSRSFCEKMRRRKKGLDPSISGDDRDRRSRSGSSTPGARKRRYSDSDDSSRDGYRNRRRRRSYSSSRSPTPDRAKNGFGRRSRSRTRSRTPQRSPSPRQPEPSSNEPSASSGPRDNVPYNPPIPSNIPPPLPFQQGFNPNLPPPPPPSQYNNQNYNGQNYNNKGPPFGAWNPPPPPPMPPNMNFHAEQPWPPPPPPPGNPPPQPYQQHQQIYQGGYPTGPGWQQNQWHQGYNNTGWSGPPNRGRGNYRGRGRGW